MAQVHILENEATKVKGRKVQEAYLDSSKKIKIVKEKLDLEIESMRVNKTAENHLDSNVSANLATISNSWKYYN